MQILIDGLLGSFLINLGEIDYGKLYNDILEHINKKYNIPMEMMRLDYNGKQLQSICRDHKEMIIDNNNKEGWIGPIHLNLPLKGGKGGFGSLLRGGPKGVKVNRVTNKDACRDLSGRRLRHVEGEKSLKEWVENVRDESHDEKMGMKYVEQQNKKKLKEQTLNSFTSETKGVKNKITESLKKGILLSKKKRKMEKLENGKDDLNDKQDNDDKQDVDEKQEIDDNKNDQNIKIINEIKENTPEKIDIKENSKDNISDIDLSKYNSSKELESLGLETLKSLLEKMGAKCGGTLVQRAERLFSIKDLKEIPQEHKAQQNNKKKRKRKNNNSK
eukprot:TRINITY_DN3557_c0_g1_i1.p1 TRINITY_DN3557_c0_g1~~TRINITY_DN3557_c0_g1_i1.p1  ORF type:complete len:330 (-),score=119.61 TRINITY_DN3557_c0_g1_i1:6-995(-)